MSRRSAQKALCVAAPSPRSLRRSSCGIDAGHVRHDSARASFVPGGGWKYVNVRRYFAFLERSLDGSTQRAVFEPKRAIVWNDGDDAGGATVG